MLGKQASVAVGGPCASNGGIHTWRGFSLSSHEETGYSRADLGSRQTFFGTSAGAAFKCELIPFVTSEAAGTDGRWRGASALREIRRNSAAGLEKSRLFHSQPETSPSHQTQAG